MFTFANEIITVLTGGQPPQNFKIMTTKDFICYVVLGIQPDFIDNLCDEFDVDFSVDDINEIIHMLTGGINEEDHYRYVGNEIIRFIYGQIIDSYNDVLDDNKFDYELDGRCSRLYYDGETIYSKQDIEKLVEQLEFEEA